MSDFWAQRGFVSPNTGTVAATALHDFAPPQPPDVTLPDDYAARVRAVELAVQLTMSKFDGGQQRVMDRARSFHAFMIGRRPYEMALNKEAYDAAEKALVDIDCGNASDCAEAAVDAAWAVIIGESNV
jgi:hypothetical protein